MPKPNSAVVAVWLGVMAIGLARAEGAASAAEDEAAMERARRAADSPFKAILEASKFKRKAAAESVVEAPRPPPEPPLRTLAAIARPAAAAGALSPSSFDAPRQQLPLQPLLPAGPDPRWVAVLTPPKLIRMVEPAIPPRLLAEIDARREFTVTMKILSDGSVADVRIDPAPPRGLQRYIVEALVQWRYEPQPVVREHRVTLVFNPA